MATMMSSCSQTKLGLEFTFHQALETLHHYIKTAPNLTWHSSQTSPSPHRGSADSKSSNLNFVCWMDILYFASMRPEKELFGRHRAVEDVFIGLVHCSQDCASFNLTSQLFISNYDRDSQLTSALHRSPLPLVYASSRGVLPVRLM